MEEAKECEYEEERAAFHSARAAVKVLPSKICAWKIKDNMSKLRWGVKGKFDAVVCAHKDSLEAIKAMNKLKFERMKVLNRVNRAMKVSNEKLKDVDIGVHDALAKFLAHDIRLAKHAKPENPLGS